MKRSTNKRAVREAAASALAPETSATPVSNAGADRDARLADRVKKDQAKKSERQSGLDARASASRKPAPKKEATPGLTFLGTGGLKIEAGSPEAFALAKAIRSSPTKKALKTANDANKTGTKSATAGQKRKQASLDAQASGIVDQKTDVRRRQGLGMDTDAPNLSHGERRMHEMIIASEIRKKSHLNDGEAQKSVEALHGSRSALAGVETVTPALTAADRLKHESIISTAAKTHGNLNHPDVLPSVTALGNGRASYIANKAIEG